MNLTKASRARDPRGSRLLSVLLAALVLVGGANLAAYAANGKPLLLGKSNAASDTTTLRNRGTGPAITLRTKSTAPPLKVTSRAKVNRLNASLLDGKTAADLGTSVHTYGIPHGSVPTTSYVINFAALPAGTYLATYNVVADLQNGSLSCFWRTNTTSPAVSRFGVDVAPSDGSIATANATAVITTDGTRSLHQLRCEGPEAFHLAADYREILGFGALSTATFTRIDSAHSGQAAVG